MDPFRGWKKYPRVMEGALACAGYADAEFAVRRAEARGATEARWTWIGGAAELTGEEWPNGLELVWDSSTGWAYRERGGDKLDALPVPVLAAPDAVIGLLPALMDGRRDQLPASEDRWEHAALLTQWVESAAVLGDDKYDAAYQRAEEEAAAFDRWQAELDGDAVPTAAPSPAEAEGTAGAAPREGGDAGAPDAAEQARRAHVDVILRWALQARDDRGHAPDPEVFGALCDFFTRAVVFPGSMELHDGDRHTSDPSRALAHLLVQHLEHFDMELEDLPELPVPDTSGDATAECVAAALRSSRWFSDAAAGTDQAGRLVMFETVLGARGVLHLADQADQADRDDGSQA
ncbi:hypothetical protein RI578_41760 (plasmid) [Streptomyces sp. BB1-1-1]|uniref:hypothetical protein n=1 Tax=Streptomyces sp. BB1-1-1 TaxID=3074430 RepID=UPI0028777C05|nr:hypothetical protein [Streptomyces sp. BB1-1-1]WND40819.1 hypothetical protein RI578_41760 [Streptomyces sp. BB1-1-1]